LSVQDGKMGANVIKIIIIFLLAGCGTQQGRETYRQELQHRADIEAEARIDSAYAAMKAACDSLLIYKVPLMADSVIRAMELTDSIKNIQ
jgi:hypothetical protein